MKRLIATIILTSYLAACTSWRVQEATPQKTSTLRITLADRRRLVVRDAQVMGDSLVGIAPRGRVAFLSADVRRIEASRLDPGKTGLAVVGIGVVIGLVVALRNFQPVDPYH